MLHYGILSLKSQQHVVLIVLGSLQFNFTPSTSPSFHCFPEFLIMFSFLSCTDRNWSYDSSTARVMIPGEKGTKGKKQITFCTRVLSVRQQQSVQMIIRKIRDTYQDQTNRKGLYHQLNYRKLLVSEQFSTSKAKSKKDWN